MKRIPNNENQQKGVTRLYPETLKLKTPRLEMAYHRAGREGAPKLMLIHGNCSSSLFYLPLMQRLADRFDVVAPDLRCFGETEAKPVDATRGMRDWSDDLDALAVALGWDRFSLGGWSLGGEIVMQYAIDHSEKLERLILIATGSPFGFGGSYDEDGKLLEPAGLASGAGCVNAQLVEALIAGDREFAAGTLERTFVLPGTPIPEDRRELYIDAILSTHVGEGLYPGDTGTATVWPFVAAGTKGVCNTMAPNYCNLSGLADIPNKPPVLWVRGDGDLLVSDTSYGDLANLGKLGMVPGYPGEEVCPLQPMLKQTRYVLERYKANGGSYREVVFHRAHGPFLDNEDAFVEELLAFFGV